MNVISASLAVGVWLALSTPIQAAEPHHSIVEPEWSEALSIDNAISEEDLNAISEEGPIESYSIVNRICNGPSKKLPIQFSSGSAKVGSLKDEDLRATLEDVLRNAGTLIVVGYTDSSGSQAANKRLALARAKTARSLLIKHYGVPPESIIAKGLGSMCPISSNDDPTGRAMNRRVVLKRRR